MGGYTTGAVTQALMQYAEENPFKEDDLVVLIYPDHGSRYISKVYNDEWMESQGFTNNELHNYDKLLKRSIYKLNYR